MNGDMVGDASISFEKQVEIIEVLQRFERHIEEANERLKIARRVIRRKDVYLGENCEIEEMAYLLRKIK